MACHHGLACMLTDHSDVTGIASAALTYLASSALSNFDSYVDHDYIYRLLSKAATNMNSAEIACVPCVLIGLLTKA